MKTKMIMYLAILNEIKVIEAKCAYLSSKRAVYHDRSMYAIEHLDSKDMKIASDKGNAIYDAMSGKWPQISKLHDKLDEIRKTMTNAEVQATRRPAYFLRNRSV